MENRFTHRESAPYCEKQATPIEPKTPNADQRNLFANLKHLAFFHLHYHPHVASAESPVRGAGYEPSIY